MKRHLIVLPFLLSLASVNAQFEAGIKAGLHSSDLVSEGIVISSGDNTYKLNFLDSEYGIHFGLYTRVSLLGFYIEPSVVFNSARVNYLLEDFDENGPFEVIKNESYNYLDIPVLIGMKLAFLRLEGGPVAHLYINSTSELTDINGYEQKFKNATYGFHVGGGVDFWKLRLRVTYEGNLSKLGDHITVDGNPYAFDDSSERLIFTVGFKF